MQSRSVTSHRVAMFACRSASVLPISVRPPLLLQSLRVHWPSPVTPGRLRVREREDEDLQLDKIIAGIKDKHISISAALAFVKTSACARAPMPISRLTGILQLFARKGARSRSNPFPRARRSLAGLLSHGRFS